MSTALEDQRRRANRWRAVVATTLRSLGVTQAEARPASRRRSDEVFGIEPDVYGVPGVHIKASPIPWGRVATYLSRAVFDADTNGRGDLPVLVRPAPAEDPADAYAIMRLSHFATLAMDAAKGREA